MQQFFIALGVGYFAGSGIVNAIAKSEALAKMFESSGLSASEVALVGGGLVYAVKPLPEGANSLVAGFLLGAGLKGQMS